VPACIKIGVRADSRSLTPSLPALRGLRPTLALPMPSLRGSLPALAWETSLPPLDAHGAPDGQVLLAPRSGTDRPTLLRGLRLALA